MSGQSRKRVKDLEEKGCYGAVTLFCLALPCPAEKNSEGARAERADGGVELCISQ